MTSKQSDMLKMAAGLMNDDSVIVKIETLPHSLEYFVSWKEPAKGERVCPDCGSYHCNIKDAGTEQTIRHIPVGDKGTLITFHKPRFVCRNCGKSFYMYPAFAAPGMSISKQLFLLIFEKLTSTSRNLTEIARDTFTSPAIVLNVMDHCDTEKPSFLPETLCIDEFNGQTGTWNPSRKRFDTEKYHCNITDGNGTQSVVIDILSDTKVNALTDYFMEYPLLQRQKVKFFCADMRKGFSKVARRCFPQAKICIDPFHVVKLLTDALKDVRVREQSMLHGRISKAEDSDAERLARSDYEIVKNSQRLLTTSPFNANRPWNRREKQKQKKLRLERIFALAPDLKVAYDAL